MRTLMTPHNDPITVITNTTIVVMVMYPQRRVMVTIPNTVVLGS